MATGPGIGLKKEKKHPSVPWVDREMFCDLRERARQDQTAAELSVS